MNPPPEAGKRVSILLRASKETRKRRVVWAGWARVGTEVRDPGLRSLMRGGTLAGVGVCLCVCLCKNCERGQGGAKNGQGPRFGGG